MVGAPFHQKVLPRKRDWVPALSMLIALGLLALWGAIDLIRRLIEWVWQ